MIRVHDRSSHSDVDYQNRPKPSHNAYSAESPKSIALICFVEGIRAGVDQPAIASLNGERGENVGAVGAGIDTDSVRPFVDLRGDRMAMHHQEAVVGFVEKERFADPA